MELLDFVTTQKRVWEAKLPLPRQVLVRDRKELDRACKKLHFPLAMKVIASAFVHKSDAKLVRTGLLDHKDTVQAYVELLRHARKADAHAAIEGLLVQEMARGTELILGVKRDPSFGPVIMAGLGGIFVEVCKDVSFRVCPITRRDAKAMLSELKGKTLLEGVRGTPKADLAGLSSIMVRLSKLALKHPEIAEIDLNPVLVDAKTIRAVDVRMLVADSGVRG